MAGKIAAQRFPHDKSVAFNRDGGQTRFGEGSVHHLVLIDVFGGERHLPARTAIRLQQRLGERRLLLVHDARGEVAKVLGAQKQIELLPVFRQPEQYHLQTGGNEGAVLWGSSGEAHVVAITGAGAETEIMDPFGQKDGEVEFLRLDQASGAPNENSGHDAVPCRPSPPWPTTRHSNNKTPSD